MLQISAAGVCTRNKMGMGCAGCAEDSGMATECSAEDLHKMRCYIGGVLGHR